ncbi:ATP-NAD kinase family protein [Atopomonas sediminilitoris]|uniref:ATP-NAD kinase family protein n=1 Tax=Atopomonas sediminilitoris TaxID=2919919 RepID=UPI001F4D7D68|nr:ATP-NAD kinase family protein [Atopomonas sediminilitoris]MCJ8169164.1 ATP-NAD kinase family protein [Atopomonas sediminilitoris]
MTSTLGLIINPLAGLGGSVALKGSDGMAEQAQALGATPRAQARTHQALEVLLPLRDVLHFLTYPGAMGEGVLKDLGFSYEVISSPHPGPTTAADTCAAVQALQARPLALLLFAGGDGTARDVCSVAKAGLPVLGVPAGVKIQSGVYAVSPRAAGELALRLLQGGLVRLTTGEVRDIDEEALRAGKVGSRYFGELCVPVEGGFLQQVKQGGVESEELVLQDLADWLNEDWEPGVRYVFGPGSTLHQLAEILGQETTLLGVDVLQDGQVIARDVTEAQLFELVDQHPAKLLVTAIGGQGHVLGRGNQQVSPRVVRAIGLEHLRVVATKRKLATLNGAPLRVDSGDVTLDNAFAPVLKVWAGYREELLYPLEVL